MGWDADGGAILVPGPSGGFGGVPVAGVILGDETLLLTREGSQFLTGNGWVREGHGDATLWWLRSVTMAYRTRFVQLGCERDVITRGSHLGILMPMLGHTWPIQK